VPPSFSSLQKLSLATETINLYGKNLVSILDAFCRALEAHKLFQMQWVITKKNTSAFTSIKGVKKAYRIALAEKN